MMARGTGKGGGSEGLDVVKLAGGLAAEGGERESERDDLEAQL